MDILEHYLAEGKISRWAKDADIPRLLAETLLVLDAHAAYSSGSAMSVGEITKCLPARTPTSISNGFTTGEDKGLLVRELNAQSSRKHDIYLTEDGKTLCQKCVDNL